MPWCAWSGAAHASTTTRVGTGLTIPTAGNINATKGGIVVHFRVNDVWNASDGYLFAAGDGGTEFSAFFNPGTGGLRYFINGAQRTDAPVVSVNVDHCAVFEWDSGADYSALFLDGVLIDEAGMGGVAWTPGTSIGIGYNPHAGAAYNSCCVITEFAVVGDLLAADEVAAIWHLRRPMIDHGATDSPGVYITDGKFKISSAYSGTRIEITPEEIAGYNESTKQFWLQAEDGKAYAGGSVVALDENGIEIEASTAFADSRSYKFKDSSGDVVGRVGAVHDEVTDDYRSVDLRTRPHAGLSSIAWVVSESPEGNGCQTNLWATHSLLNYDHEAFISLDTNESNVSRIWWTIDGVQMGSIKANYTGFVLRGEAEAGDDVRLQSDWELTYATSARATKVNIADFTADRSAFMLLKPSTYNAKRSPNGRPMIGLIAEDVDLAFPDLVTRRLPRPVLEERNGQRRPGMPTGSPQISGWDDRQMLVTVISVVQQQERDLTTLEARVAGLEAT